MTFLGRQKEITVAASTLTPEPNKLKIFLHTSDNLTIECGDVDGVVCGLWVSVDNSSPVSEICEDNGHAGYWACAFAWSNAWDDRTMERVSSMFFFPFLYYRTVKNMISSWSGFLTFIMCDMLHSFIFMLRKGSHFLIHICVTFTVHLWFAIENYVLLQLLNLILALN